MIGGRDGGLHLDEAVKRIRRSRPEHATAEDFHVARRQHVIAAQVSGTIATIAEVSSVGIGWRLVRCIIAAVELCSRAVTAAPDAKAERRLLVPAEMALRRRVP